MIETSKRLQQLFLKKRDRRKTYFLCLVTVNIITHKRQNASCNSFLKTNFNIFATRNSFRMRT